jgi:hypothetical protein
LREIVTIWWPTLSNFSSALINKLMIDVPVSKIKRHRINVKYESDKIVMCRVALKSTHDIKTQHIRQRMIVAETQHMIIRIIAELCDA